MSRKYSADWYSEMGDAERYARIVSRFVVVVGLLIGGAMLSYAAYIWLRAGEWEAITAMSALQWLGIMDAAWASSPRDWIGLHRLLEVFPLGAAIPLLALLVAGVIFSVGRMRGDEQLARQRATQDAWRGRNELTQ